MNIARTQRILRGENVDLKRVNKTISLVETLSKKIRDCFLKLRFSSGQSLSHVQLLVIPWNSSMPGFPFHHQLLELAQTHVH